MLDLFRNRKKSMVLAVLLALMVVLLAHVEASVNTGGDGAELIVNTITARRSVFNNNTDGNSSSLFDLMDLVNHAFMVFRLPACAPHWSGLHEQFQGHGFRFEGRRVAMALTSFYNSSLCVYQFAHFI